MGSSSWRTAGIITVAVPTVIVGGAVVIQLSRGLWNRWKWRGVPGPSGNLFVGTLFEILGKGGSHIAIQGWTKKYGRVFKMPMLSSVSMVVTDAELARALCFKFLNRGTLSSIPRSAARAVQGPNTLLDDKGLLQSRDGYWRILRNAWQPVFAPGSLQRYAALMEGTSQQLVAVLNKMSQGGSQVVGTEPGAVTTTEEDGDFIDIHELLMNMTLETVGTCAYGVHFHALPTTDTAVQQHAAGKALSNSVKVFFQSASLRAGSKWMFAMALLPPLSYFIVPFAKLFPDQPLVRIKKAGQTVRTTGQALVDVWRAERGLDKATQNVSKVVVGPDGKLLPAGRLSGVDQGSFLDLILAAQERARKKLKSAKSNEAPGAMRTQPSATAAPPGSDQSVASSTITPEDAAAMLDDQSVTAQANTFIMAGTETTAGTLTFAVYLLSQNPEAEKKLVAEADSLDWSQPVTRDTHTPYAEAVVSETLRVFPPAHATSREIDRDDFDVGGYKMRKGSLALIAIYSIHHDPEYWPRATEFLPERWLPEHEKELGPTTPAAYMPFGAGPRQCPGFKFALQEARIALLHLYRHFTIQLAPGQEPLPTLAGISLTPSKGLKVKLTPRVHTAVEAAKAA